MCHEDDTSSLMNKPTQIIQRNALRNILIVTKDQHITELTPCFDTPENRETHSPANLLSNIRTLDVEVFRHTNPVEASAIGCFDQLFRRE